MGVSLIYPRKNFGNADVPFWSNVTDLENNILKSIDELKNGEPESLLAFAVFASGDVRTETEYKIIKKRIISFVKQVKPEIDNEDDYWRKGYKLHRFMHREFLSAEEGNFEKYDFEQSSFAKLIRTGEYNCISSAMLYMILARYFKMEVEGVCLPSHVFVQLVTPTGRKIEIETTSYTGFGWAHNEEFYRNKAQEWAASRNLQRLTYKDYKDRKIVEPYRLIVMNMINQHTKPGKMKPVDTRRLLEARGYIEDDVYETQKDMLYVYLSEYDYMSNNSDYNTSVRMFKKVEPRLLSIEKKWYHNKEVINKLVWCYFYYAYSLLKIEEENLSLKWVEKTFSLTDNRLEDFVKLKENSILMVGNLIVAYAKKEQFKKAESLVNKYRNKLKSYNKVYKNIEWFYRTWSKFYQDKSMWTGMIEKLKKELEWTASETGRREVKEFIATGYKNIGDMYNDNKDWLNAVKIYNQAVKWGQSPEIKSYLFNSIITCYLSEYVEEDNYIKGAEVIEKYNEICGDYKWWNTTRAWFYDKWAAYYWKKSIWDKAIEKYLVELEIEKNIQGKNISRIKNNISAVYGKMADSYWKKKEWNTVIDYHEKMLEWSQSEQEKKQILKNVYNAYFNLSLEYYNAGNWKKVYEIFQGCVKRFPGCEEAHNELKKLKREYSF